MQASTSALWRAALAVIILAAMSFFAGIVWFPQIRESPLQMVLATLLFPVFVVTMSLLVAAIERVRMSPTSHLSVTRLREVLGEPAEEWDDGVECELSYRVGSGMVVFLSESAKRGGRVKRVDVDMLP